MAKRTIRDISAQYDRFRDKVWWNRHMAHGEPEAGQGAAGGIEDRYGKAFLDPGNDIEWGICQGKMMALAWVLGMEWDEAGDT